MSPIGTLGDDDEMPGAPPKKEPGVGTNAWLTERFQQELSKTGWVYGFNKGVLNATAKRLRDEKGYSNEEIAVLAEMFARGKDFRQGVDPAVRFRAWLKVAA